ncbi:MAG: response regulator [Gammaproteobacteria bacterium]
MPSSLGHTGHRLTFRERQPRILVCALGTLLAVCNLTLDPKLGAGFTVSLVPFIVMSTALLGGWVIAAICAVIAALAELLTSGDVVAVAFGCAVAVVCGEMLRRGVRPIVIAGMQFASIILVNSPHLSAPEALPFVQLCAAALAHAGLTAALATGVLILTPRRRANLPLRCRLRGDHIVFILTVGALSLVTVAVVIWTRPQALANGYGWGENSALRLSSMMLTGYVTNLVLTARFSNIARRMPRLLAGTQPGRSQRKTLRSRIESPLEVAHFLVSVNRERRRLRRDVARQARESSATRDQARRLTQEILKARHRLKLQSDQLRALARSNDYARSRYHALMNLSGDVTLFCNEKGMIQSVSRSAERMLGYAPAELKGQPITLLIPQSSPSDHPLDVARKTPVEGAASMRETTVRSADGKNKEVIALLSSFATRGTVNFSIQLREITNMKKALATLEQAQTLAQSAHRSRDQFIAAMSHELRTPLHGLIATLEMMRAGENCAPEMRQHLSIARISARALLKIANDILDLTRIESGHFTLEHRPFSPLATIQEVVDESRARADSVGLTLQLRIVDSLPPALIGDPGRLKQILHNLISNALKFTPSGGVTLQVTCDGTGCTFDVIDTGKGIPEDKWKTIFDPFVQVESVRGRQAGGTGLGLPISRRLAEAMGGNLTLLRSSSAGSTFRLVVSLPVTQEALAEEQSQRIFNNPRGRILVVEDNAANRYVAEALLTSLECPVTIVESGEEALARLEKEEFDLILMDCQMPGLDGFETTRRARRLLRRHVPVIAMTANASVEDRQRCLEAGMDDFLPKPFGRQALHALLCKWLEPARISDRVNDELAAQVRALPALDVVVFDELRQSLQWRVEPLQRICTTFTDSARNAFGVIEGSTGIDRRALRRHLHTLLGSAGMVGARQAEHVARAIQRDVESNRLDDVDAALALLRGALQAFEKEFNRRLQESSGEHYGEAAGGREH